VKRRRRGEKNETVLVGNRNRGRAPLSTTRIDEGQNSHSIHDYAAFQHQQPSLARASIPQCHLLHFVALHHRSNLLNYSREHLLYVCLCLRLTVSESSAERNQLRIPNKNNVAMKRRWGINLPLHGCVFAKRCRSYRLNDLIHRSTFSNSFCKFYFFLFSFFYFFLF